jgi:hypothetical protein
LQIAFVNKEAGEFGERRSTHPEEAAHFYRSLAGSKVRVGSAGFTGCGKSLLNCKKRQGTTSVVP